METYVDRIIQKFGTQSAVAAAAKVKQPSVAGWRKAGLIPKRREGALLAEARAQGIDLSLEDFFPQGGP